jgi:uncharacterized YccA/Bax inhibitor family protein
METSNPLLKRADSFSGTAETATMNLNGVVNKTGILLLICMAGAYYGWVTPNLGWGVIMVAMFGALICSLVAIFKPVTSPYLAPVYAGLEGVVLGAISAVENAAYPGIAANAILLTFSILGLFLLLYATRIVRVTNGMRIAVIAATGGICVVYLIDMVLHIFGHGVPFINSSGPMGIGISVLICAIAAFNFFLDFDAIERFIQAGAPKYMEWYSGMALLITLVWLYLEILRLLSKLNSRR